MADFVITSYGAIGDGETNDAAAIQKTIEACASHGGGRVIVPTGATFLSGALELKSNVELHIERGAVLLSSGNIEDFPHRDLGSKEGCPKQIWIYAVEAENVAVTGGGAIDGNHQAYRLPGGETQYIMKGVVKRPAMTCFIGCRHLRFHDTTFRNAANWTLHFSGCEDVVVHAVSILNDLRYPNCDGIDPDHCKNVRISDCHIEAGDDCIVIKNTRLFREYGPCENITVTNCTLKSTSAAIKIGSESVDDFRNLVFTGCSISGTNRGLAIQLRDEGSVENLLFANMVVQTRYFADDWWGAAEPIYITARPREAGKPVGRIDNVVFSNIMCHSENGVFIDGCEESRPTNILLDNVKLSIEKTSKWPGGRYDSRPGVEGAVFESPTAGIRCRNAERITIRDCEVRWKGEVEDYFGSAVDAREVAELELDNFRGDAAHPDRDDAVVNEI